MFEIASTQSLGNAGRKAAKLAARGVRRVFAIDVERSRALEWSAELATWRELDPAGHIDDPALEVPLPIEDMIVPHGSCTARGSDHRSGDRRRTPSALQHINLGPVRGPDRSATNAGGGARAWRARAARAR